MKFRYLLVSIILLAVFGGFWWFLGGQSQTALPPTTAKVTRGDISQTVLASGQIEASQLVSVGARVSGQIEKLAVTLGQQVAAGDLIASIESRDQQNEVSQAEADLANLDAQIAAKQANLQLAELVLTRQAALGSNNYASRDAVETATANVDVLKADLKALDAQKARAGLALSTAQTGLERTRITAPIAGTVVAIVVEEGQTVNALQSAPTLVKLANLDRVVIKAEISEADVVRVKPGQDVSFTILGEPGEALHTKLRDIEPAPSDIKTSDTISTDTAIYYNGLMEVDNPDHLLRIGMTTQVIITLTQAQDVLRVPAGALSGNTVQLWDPTTGTTATRPVKVGLNDKVMAEIQSGLAEGDQVVVASGGAAPAGRTGGQRMRAPMGF